MDRQPPSDDQRVQQFSRLLVANQRRIHGFILSLVHDRSAAADVLQDVSVLLWEKFDLFEPGTDFGAWGMAVAQRTVFNWRRKQKKVPLPLEDELLAVLADEAVKVSCEYDDRRVALGKCLQGLSDENRDLLLARYELARSVASIAERLGRSRVAVYKRLNRIRRLLLDCINGRLQAEGVQ
jgi:RNA polymerase sigma-70 factor (ECF subfamily)